MASINNDIDFRNALSHLDETQQRIVAAKIVEKVLSLANDERLNRVIKLAMDVDANNEELLGALAIAKSVAIDTHARCGSEGNWTEQAGYFVARAAIAAVSPENQCKHGGPAWAAAMSSRMAQMSILIDSEDPPVDDNNWQYQILTEYLQTQQ